MKITIAGASSFIGKRMLKILATKEGVNVVAVVRKRSSQLEEYSSYSNVKIIECDMNDYDRLGELAGAGDVFINYTWAGSRGDARMDSDLQKKNYECSISAAISMINFGYKTLITSGSQAEYGQVEGEITEDTIPKPNTEYGKYKLLIYERLKEIADRHCAKLIEPRYFSLYGPEDYEKTLIMSVIRKMLVNEDVVLNSCTQLWDYLYVDDSCDALLCLLENDAPAGVYNFASGIHKPLKDFVLDIKRALQSDSKVEFNDCEKFKGLIINLQPKVDKLFKATNGWTPKVSFLDGIREIVK